MHFALPPKSTHAPYRPASRSSSSLRRKPLQVTAIVAVAFCTFYLFLSYIFAGDATEVVPAGTPPVVIVTVLDETTMSQDYISKIKGNRDDYARRHGYANFYTNTTLYAPYLESSPSSWSIVPALRHAMNIYSHSQWFFALSPHSLFMNPTESLEDHLLEPAKLSSLMLKDIPVVPPDSVIHTFSHLQPEKVDLILTQDADSLAHGSFLLRKGEWAKYFLDSWMDPLYRSYNFQKAEGHALEHLTQWHPTILSHLCLVPQRTINAYNFESSTDSSTQPSNGGSLYNEGDLIISLSGCDDSNPARNCEKEYDGYWAKWREIIGRLT